VTNSANPATGTPDGGPAATPDDAATSDPAASDDDFLDSGLYGAAGAGAGAGDGAGAHSVSPSGWTGTVRPAAWLAAGVVAGTVAVAAWHSSQTTTPLANPAAAQGQLPNGQAPNGQVPNGQVPNGQAPNGQAPNGGPGFGGPGTGGPGFGGTGPGGRAGEQRVNGTVTTVTTSSVTVRLANGSTATYGVVASSDIVKNGARVSLSAIKPGDAVFLHVYPLNGHTVIEHLFAGPPPSSGPGTGPGPGTSTQSGTTTT
jgi:hypothetical protein